MNGILKPSKKQIKFLIKLVEIDFERGIINMIEKRFLISRLFSYEDTKDIKYIKEFNQMAKEIARRQK